MSCRDKNMRNIFRGAIKNVYTLYMIGLLLYSFTPGLAWIIGDMKYVKYYPLLGLIPFFACLAFNRFRINKKGSFLFLLLIPVYAAHAIYWGKYLSTSHIIKQFFWIVLDTLIIYCYDVCFEEREQYIKSLIILSKLFVATCLLLNILSFGLLVFGIKIDAYPSVMGCYLDYGRCYGITDDSLGMSVYLIFSWVVSLGLVIHKKLTRRWLVICSLNFVLSLIFLGGLVSRGSFLLICISSLLFWTLYNLLRKKICIMTIARIICGNVAIAGAVIASMFFLINLAMIFPRIGRCFVPDSVVSLNNIVISIGDGNGYVHREVLDAGSATYTREVIGNYLSEVEINSATKGLTLADRIIKILIGIEEVDSRSHLSFGSCAGFSIVIRYGIIGSLLFLTSCVITWIKSIKWVKERDYDIEVFFVLMIISVTVGGMWRYILIPSYDVCALAWWLFMGYLERTCINDSRIG